ncbi:acyl-CoA dehydrogenase family protein [Zhongshania sp.]|uniref:acyl-CoA dehydrogenase family protein n=1 Tax=Zhongshania sp. TaxID=1971902 RepID=UPI001B55DD36|nr:acyl-CoA dehydrogenase family protein [Zhongshania sp.]MBQ0794884.1 acyl-CoA dehydrogenase family protein [Zhongshania sp.]
MDFSFTEEQILLRRSLQNYLANHYVFEHRRQTSVSESGWCRNAWKDFAELGILAMPFAEHLGGLNAGPVDTMVVMEELGRALVLEPYLETVVLCGGLLSRVSGEQVDACIQGIAAGDEILALAWAEAASRFDFAGVACRAEKHDGNWRISGEKSVVIAGPWADKFIVSARTSGKAGDAHGLSLFLINANAEGLKAKSYPTIDGRRACDLYLDKVVVETILGDEGSGVALLQEVFDGAIAAQSAEALGVLACLQEDTVAYSKERKQFGQAISNFQALQHRMVDMYMNVEMVRSATLLATLNLDGDSLARSRAASAAKVTVAKACRFVGQNAVQLHGGMGMTDELRISHYFKRATQIETEFGNADYHLKRHSQLSRDAA